jgi:aldose 1-epimerase
MHTVSLQDSRTGSFAVVVPQHGFNCVQFVADVNGHRMDIIDTQPDFIATGNKPSWSGIPILFPFPNRIRGGRFRWAGRDFQLPLTPGHPHSLHGFCLDRAWRVIDQQSDAVTGQFHLSVDAPDRRELWPADFVIEVCYRLSGPVLSMDVQISNPSDVVLPWGLGTHPYFKLPPGPSGDFAACLVQVPARAAWTLVECLPTGERRPVDQRTNLQAPTSIAGRKLDDVLTGLTAPGGEITTRIIDPQAGLQVVQLFPGAFRELVVFTPPWTHAVCLEPYTCVTDAVNLQSAGIDAGLRTLDPGESFRTAITIRAEPLL